MKLSFIIILYLFTFQAPAQAQLKDRYVGDMFGTTLLFLNINDSTASLFYFNDAVLLSCSKESFFVEGDLIFFENIGVFKIKKDKLRLKKRTSEWVRRRSKFKYNNSLIEEYSNHLSHHSRGAKKNNKIFICTKPNPMDDE